jgi:uncharacterized SAM-binding protein YcdF (DUF218 family)
MGTMTYVGLTFPIFLILAIVGAWRVWHSAERSNPWMLAVGVIGIFLLSWSPSVWLASQPLEAWYPRGAPGASDAQVIVVLSGGVLPAGASRPVAVASVDTSERTAYAAWLYHNWKAVPVLACGGRMESDNPPLAEPMRALLTAANVPSEVIWTEEHSRSTYENAVDAAAILRSKGIRNIALVTEAYHMPRAERAFRKQGLHVTPVPCCKQTLSLRPGYLLPNASSIRKSEALFHEAAGLLLYWALGRI